MYRIGHAHDIHKLVEGRKLILAGVEIPFEKGALGHSDADVILHALAESILGALALGDLGKHFPDSDGKYKDIASSKLIETVIVLMEKEGYHVVNTDISLHLEKPKVAPFIEAMRSQVASLLKVQLNQVSIKAGTNEGVGPVGLGDAVEATATTLLRKA